MRLATSNASKSCVRCTYAFFLPSGRMSVLTFAHFTSYNAWTASLIFGFVALISTMKTSVLISSIFFIADSVVTGYWMIRYLSILSRRSDDFRGYLGSRGLLRVLGRKKCTFVRTFRTFFVTADFKALETFPAFLAAPFLSAFSAFSAGAAGCALAAFALGAMVHKSL